LGGLDGATSANGSVVGTYLHGCFASDAFRRAFIASLGGHAGSLAYDSEIDQTLDELADHLERHVNLDMILGLAATPKF
jgi:adenosylcobyric acid synthase